MKNYKLSIPKPCHENWATMTPNEKGKFCSSCSKTVVDFTKKSSQEIQNYLRTNSGKRVCGHFKRKQLDSIVIQLPENVFLQQLSYSKIFLVTLLLVMGTTLFSCKPEVGKTQKIEKVEILSPTDKPKDKIDSTFIEKLNIISPKTSSKLPLPSKANGVTIIESTGEVSINEITKFNIDKIIEIEEEENFEKENFTLLPEPIDSLPDLDVMGDIIEVEEVDDNFIEGELIIEKVPFNNSSSLPLLNNNDFREEISNYIIENLKIKGEELFLGTGNHKIISNFTITKKGNIENIKVKTKYKKAVKIVEDALKELPKLTPAKQNGRPVKLKYTLPITLTIN